jgi:hypothetical protein
MPRTTGPGAHAPHRARDSAERKLARPLQARPTGDITDSEPGAPAQEVLAPGEPDITYYQQIVMHKVLTVRDPVSRMALDRYEYGGDGPNDVEPEQHQWHAGSGGDPPAARAEPAEVRTRAQYYEARRAADCNSAPASDSQRAGSDTRGDHGG